MVVVVLQPSTHPSMCQSPLKWPTWFKTSTTLNPTVRVRDPQLWKQCLGAWVWVWVKLRRRGFAKQGSKTHMTCTHTEASDRHLALCPDLTFSHLPSGMTDQLERCCLFPWNTTLHAKGLQEFFLEAMQKALMVLASISQCAEGGLMRWDVRGSRAGRKCGGVAVICQQNCMKTVSLLTRL